MLREPAAGGTDSALGKRCAILILFGRKHCPVNEATAIARPLHALMLDAPARKTQPIFYRNSILRKTFQE
jgi:hypothetical protein